jgi:hypothetical protein
MSLHVSIPGCRKVAQLAISLWLPNVSFIHSQMTEALVDHWFIDSSGCGKNALKH